jgi:hypothetical protein
MAQENENIVDWFYYVEIPVAKFSVFSVRDKQEFLVSPFGELSFYDTYKIFENTFSMLYYYKPARGIIEKYVPIAIRLLEPLTQEEYNVAYETFTVSALIRLSSYQQNKEVPLLMKIVLYDTYSRLEKTIEVRGVARGFSVKLPVKVAPQSHSVKYIVEYQGKQYVNYRSTFSMRITEWYLEEPNPLFDLLKPKSTNFHTRVLRSSLERKISNPYSANIDITYFLKK